MHGSAAAFRALAKASGIDMAQLQAHKNTQLKAASDDKNTKAIADTTEKEKHKAKEKDKGKKKDKEKKDDKEVEKKV